MSQSNMPNYPSPSGPGAAPGGSRVPVAAPMQVVIAFWLYMAAAAVSLISLVVSVATAGASRSAVQQQLSSQGQKFTSSQLDAVITLGIVIAVVLGVIFIAAYVIFDLFLRRGAGWARIVLLIVTVFSLFQVLGGYGLGGLRFVLGLIATILVFLPAASEYFRAVKANRASGLR